MTTLLATPPRDLTESRTAVFGRAPVEFAIDHDGIRAITELRALHRDGLDTSATQDAIITALKEKSNVA